jgi:hypothetical protein
MKKQPTFAFTRRIAIAFEESGKRLVREAARDGRSLVVSRNGKPVAVDARELEKELRRNDR